MTELCPDTVQDAVLKQKCAGTEAETFADFIWMSSSKTIKIYTNKFCAEVRTMESHRKLYGIRVK